MRCAVANPGDGCSIATRHGLPKLVPAPGAELTADLDQVVPEAAFGEQRCYRIDRVPLGDGREVDDHVRTPLPQRRSARVHFQQVGACPRPEGGERRRIRRRRRPPRRSEAPGVDQRTDGHVERAAAHPADCQRLGHHPDGLHRQRLRFGRPRPVEARELRIGTIVGHAAFDALEGPAHLLLEGRLIELPAGGRSGWMDGLLRTGERLGRTTPRNDGDGERRPHRRAADGPVPRDHVRSRLRRRGAPDRGQGQRGQRLRPRGGGHGIDMHGVVRLCIMLHTERVERDSRQLIRLLERDGRVRVAVRGSHWQFKHPDRTGRVTVPHPKRNIKRGTVASIYRQAGWTSRRN